MRDFFKNIFYRADDETIFDLELDGTPPDKTPEERDKRHSGIPLGTELIGSLLEGLEISLPSSSTGNDLPETPESSKVNRRKVYDEIISKYINEFEKYFGNIERTTTHEFKIGKYTFLIVIEPLEKDYIIQNWEYHSFRIKHPSSWQKIFQRYATKNFRIYKSKGEEVIKSAVEQFEDSIEYSERRIQETRS